GRRRPPSPHSPGGEPRPSPPPSPPPAPAPDHRCEPGPAGRGGPAPGPGTPTATPSAQTPPAPGRSAAHAHWIAHHENPAAPAGGPQPRLRRALSRRHPPAQTSAPLPRTRRGDHTPWNDPTTGAPPAAALSANLSITDSGCPTSASPEERRPGERRTQPPHQPRLPRSGDRGGAGRRTPAQCEPEPGPVCKALKEFPGMAGGGTCLDPARATTGGGYLRHRPSRVQVPTAAVKRNFA